MHSFPLAPSPSAVSTTPPARHEVLYHSDKMDPSMPYYPHYAYPSPTQPFGVSPSRPIRAPGSLDEPATQPDGHIAAAIPGGVQLPSVPNTGQRTYAFVSLAGSTIRKRPHKRYEDIERLYSCSFEGCTKSYGTLNHLNAHVTMQKHGPKRNPSEFKELRKQWRSQKKAEQVTPASHPRMLMQHGMVQGGDGPHALGRVSFRSLDGSGDKYNDESDEETSQQEYGIGERDGLLYLPGSHNPGVQY